MLRAGCVGADMQACDTEQERQRQKQRRQKPGHRRVPEGPRDDAGAKPCHAVRPKRRYGRVTGRPHPSRPPALVEEYRQT